MKSKRGGAYGSKRLDVGAMRDLLSSTQLVTALGIVRQFPGEDSHYEISAENGDREILVDVELIPSGTKLQCRLGFGNDGVYRIPRVDQEVAVLVPYDPQSLIRDSLDYGGIIVGVLDNSAPSQLDSDDIVVIKSGTVKVIADSIELGDSPGLADNVVVGSGIDSFTGSTYKVLGNTSAIVKAKK
jgi:hypothetical protein